jgi:hypothetical protein
MNNQSPFLRKSFTESPGNGLGRNSFADDFNDASASRRRAQPKPLQQANHSYSAPKPLQGRNLGIFETNNDDNNDDDNDNDDANDGL